MKELICSLRVSVGTGCVSLAQLVALWKFGGSVVSRWWRPDGLQVSKVDVGSDFPRQASAVCIHVSSCILHPVILQGVPSY